MCASLALWPLELAMSVTFSRSSDFSKRQRLPQAPATTKKPLLPKSRRHQAKPRRLQLASKQLA
jgi:hypothetical protein